MINAALKNSEKDMLLIEREIRDEAAASTDENVKVVRINSEKELELFLASKENADIICVDVSLKNGIQSAERLRTMYSKAAIFIVADENMSPVKYMKPQIMAAALALKPLDAQMVRAAVRQIFDFFINTEGSEDFFIVENREIKQRIPYNSILYFEARMKKIYVCTESREYGFYDTMEHLEESLSNDFIRCHRGYIVNRRYIRDVMLTQGIVVIGNDIEVPLSRSYKSIFKNERKNG